MRRKQGHIAAGRKIDANGGGETRGFVVFRQPFTDLARLDAHQRVFIRVVMQALAKYFRGNGAFLYRIPALAIERLQSDVAKKKFLAAVAGGETPRYPERLRGALKPLRASAVRLSAAEIIRH